MKRLLLLALLLCCVLLLAACGAFPTLMPDPGAAPAINLPEAKAPSYNLDEMQNEIDRLQRQIAEQTPVPVKVFAPPLVADSSDNHYVLNTSTHVFHCDWCPYVQEIGSENGASVTWSREECISAGYRPCERCEP